MALSTLLLCLMASIMFPMAALLATIQPTLVSSPKVMATLRLRQVSWRRAALLLSLIPARRMLSVLLVGWLLPVCAWDWGWGPVLVLVLAAVGLLWWWRELLLLRVVVCVLWGGTIGRLLLLLLAAAIFVIAAVFRVLSLGAI